MQDTNPQSANAHPAVIPFDSLHNPRGNASVLHDGVPALEKSVDSLRRLAEQRVLGLAELVEVIESDFALAANVMRLAIKHGGRAESIEDAVVLLGRHGLAELAANTPVLRPRDGNTLLWGHSVATARRCAILLRDAPQATRQRGKLAALLHDLGRVVTCDFEDDPEQITGGLHCVVGEYLARQWMLPDFIRNVIRFHHESGYEGEHADVVRVVQSADRLSTAALRNRKAQ